MSERLVHQGDIEAEILRISDLLERATGELASAAEEAAEAEADYRVAYAKEFYSPKRPEGEFPGDGPKLTEKLRESLATIACDEALHRHKIAAARQLALQEKCRQLRAQLDAVRTLSANVRGQT